MKRTRFRRGMTLIEALMAAVMTALTLITGIGIYISGLMSWYQGEGMIDAEQNSRNAVRIMAIELRKAMSVTVDPNGLGLTYALPATDNTGTYIVPLVNDGVTRRIELDGTNINIKANGVSNQICTGVVLNDPNSQNDSAGYRIFTAGGGANTRSITIMVVSQKNGYGAASVTSRNRETIYLRNVPQLTH